MKNSQVSLLSRWSVTISMRKELENGNAWECYSYSWSHFMYSVWWHKQYGILPFLCTYRVKYMLLKVYYMIMQPEALFYKQFVFKLLYHFVRFPYLKTFCFTPRRDDLWFWKYSPTKIMILKLVSAIFGLLASTTRLLTICDWIWQKSASMSTTVRSFYRTIITFLPLVS